LQRVLQEAQQIVRATLDAG